MEEQEYSLKESFRKIGILPGASILIDQNGNVIDGLHCKITAQQLGLDIRKVVVNIKNPAQAHIIKLVKNKCRRQMKPAEITQSLDVIGQNLKWSAKDFLKHLPFSYSWLMKYLPEKYKDPIKAAAGAVGGRARAEAVRRAKESATQRQAEVEPLEEAAKADAPSVEEFCKRFANTFSSHIARFTALSSHITTVRQKDLPTIFDYMDETHDCSKCNMRFSICEKLVKLYKEEQLRKLGQELLDFHEEIPRLVPVCIKNRLNETP